MLTPLGEALDLVLRGRVVTVTEAAMVAICHDLEGRSPRRYVRSIPAPGGRYRVALVGQAVFPARGM
jgi:hypothetical protein